MTERKTIYLDDALEPEKKIKRHKTDFSDLEAEPERKTGKWIRESLVTDYPYKCLACKKYSRAMYDFCPNCGAFMRGDKECQ